MIRFRPTNVGADLRVCPGFDIRMHGLHPREGPANHPTTKIHHPYG
ncbi:MAG: hypothetical protein WD267_01860 [Balneolales bacterium]